MEKAGHAEKKPLKKWRTAILILAVLFAGALIFTNAAVLYGNDPELESGLKESETGAAFIVVLGAKVDGDEPGKILENRLETGIELYKQGKEKKLLLTGDGGQHRYDEVSVMKRYALKAGVPETDILTDREGFDTYSSMCRARTVYGIQNAIVVTQAYHMPRALYDARAFGMEVKSAAAKTESENQWLRDLREIPARAKDYIVCLFKPEPRQYD